MHSTIFFTALAASGSLVSALSGSGFVDKRHGSLIDIDAVVGPILNDVELIDLDRRAIVPNCNADSGLQVTSAFLHTSRFKRSSTLTPSYTLFSSAAQEANGQASKGPGWS